MVTIYDVAKKAGVSPSTVSRVLNNYDNVTEQTQKKVMAACKKLNFIPNANASNLKKKTTKTLALFIPDIENPFFTSVLKGFEGKVAADGYNTIICDTDEKIELEENYTRMVMEKRLDGVAVSTISRSKEHLEKIKEQGIPLVLLDRKIEELNVDTVCGDSYRGAVKLMNHLLKRGYRKIAMITASLHLSTSKERLAGYRETLKNNGVKVNDSYIKIDNKNDGYSKNGGYLLTRELLVGGRYPDAIFAGNNFMALGAYKAVREFNLKVPADIAVVCFDDLHLTYELEPFFTAVVQPAYTMGKMAADLLINKIEGEYENNVQQIVLQSELKIRKSS